MYINKYIAQIILARCGYRHIYMYISFSFFQIPQWMDIEKKLTSWKSSTIALYALGPFWCTGLAHWNVWIFTHVHYLSGKTVEINLANFLLKIQLPQQLTLPWYLPRVQLGLAFVNYFPGSCFLLRHSETVGGMLSQNTVCSNSWKTFFSPGPLLATEAQSPQVFEISGTAGKACVRRLGLQSAAVCWCCRSLAVFPQAQPWPWLMPEPGWWCCSQSQALCEHEPEHHLHSVLAPAPTLTWAHLLLQQPSTHISFLLYQASNWALFPPAWCDPQWSLCYRDGLLTPAGEHKCSLFSPLLSFPCSTKWSGSELARWG